MFLTEEQEDIREQILQQHKSKEMEIIKKIERQCSRIKSLHDSDQIKEAQRVLIGLQEEYNIFESFMSKEVDLVLFSKKTKSRLSSTDIIQLCKTHNISNLYFRKITIPFNGFVFLYNQKEYTCLKTLADVHLHDIQCELKTKVNIYTSFAYMKDGIKHKLNTIK
jgi:hypothetical protein